MCRVWTRCAPSACGQNGLPRLSQRHRFFLLHENCCRGPRLPRVLTRTTSALSRSPVRMAGTGSWKTLGADDTKTLSKTCPTEQQPYAPAPVRAHHAFTHLLILPAPPLPFFPCPSTFSPSLGSWQDLNPPAWKSSF